MKETTLAGLVCPYCAGRLEPRFRTPASGPEIESAILVCGCGEFPLLGGIPIFLREGRVDVMRQTVHAPMVRGPTVSRLRALIRAGAAEEALQRLVVWPGPWMRRALGAVDVLPLRLQPRLRRVLEDVAAHGPVREKKVFASKGSSTTAREALASYVRQSGKVEHFHHFYHRFTQPRHLSILATAAALPSRGGWSVDIACGFGHTLYSWMSGRESGTFLGLDRNFFELYIARRWVAPRAEYVCASADERIPFPDGAFEAVLCADSFHCFLRKQEAADEFVRVLAPEGALALARFGNARVEPREGYELEPEGYARLFHGIETRFFRDPDLLARYLSRRLPDMSVPGTPDDVASQKWITLVASRDPAVFRDHGAFEEWPHGVGRLALNPLYRVSESNGRAALALHFPTKWFAFENAECLTYMPEHVDVDPATLADVAAARRTESVERLIGQGVVLGLPETYG
jgi:SAM-dependent methyltransferase